MSPRVLDCWNSMVRAVQAGREAIEEAHRWTERNPGEAEAAAQAIRLWEAAAPCLPADPGTPAPNYTEATLQRLLNRLDEN